MYYDNVVEDIQVYIATSARTNRMSETQYRITSWIHIIRTNKLTTLFLPPAPCPFTLVALPRLLHMVTHLASLRFYKSV